MTGCAILLVLVVVLEISSNIKEEDENEEEDEPKRGVFHTRSSRRIMPPMPSQRRLVWICCIPKLEDFAPLARKSGAEAQHSRRSARAAPPGPREASGVRPVSPPLYDQAQARSAGPIREAGERSPACAAAPRPRVFRIA